MTSLTIAMFSFDNELQAHWNAVLREFPAEKIHLVSHSDDFSRMIVKVFGARDGYVYASFDWYSHQGNYTGQGLQRRFRDGRSAGHRLLGPRRTAHFRLSHIAAGIASRRTYP